MTDIEVVVGFFKLLLGDSTELGSEEKKIGNLAQCTYILEYVRLYWVNDPCAATSVL